MGDICGAMGENPATGIKLNREHSRDRLIQGDEHSPFRLCTFVINKCSVKNVGYGRLTVRQAQSG